MNTRKQQGSSTLLSLVVMVFLGVVIAGLMPMTVNSLRFSRDNQDVIGVQFVAEAGAKRAIAGFLQKRQDWAWADGKSKISFEDNSDKSYVVSISPAVVDGAVPAAGVYTITSTGYIGSYSRKVSVQVEVGSGGSNPYVSGDVFGKYALYSKGDGTIWGGEMPKINGNMGFGGSNVSIGGGNNFLQSANGAYYKIYAKQEIGGWHPWLQPSMTVVDPNQDMGSMNIKVPTLPTLPAILGQLGSKPGGAADLTGSTTNLSSAAYYYNGSYTRGGTLKSTNSAPTTLYVNGSLHLSNQGPYSNGVIETSGDAVIYVNGSIDLSNGSIIRSTGGNVTIYASGGLSLSGGSYIESSSGNVTVLTNQTISLTDNTSNHIQAGTGGNLTVVSRQGSVSFNNNCYMNGGNAFLQAADSIDLRQYTGVNATSGYSNAMAYLFANRATTSNEFTIGGSAAMFVSNTGFNFSNTFHAGKTIFIAGSGSTNVSNGPTLGGLYTNGVLSNLTNSPTITYDASALQKLGLLGGGGLVVKNWDS